MFAYSWYWKQKKHIASWAGQQLTYERMPPPSDPPLPMRTVYILSGPSHCGFCSSVCLSIRLSTTSVWVPNSKTTWHRKTETGVIVPHVRIFNSLVQGLDSWCCTGLSGRPHNRSALNCRFLSFSLARLWRGIVLLCSISRHSKWRWNQSSVASLNLHHKNCCSCSQRYLSLLTYSIASGWMSVTSPVTSGWRRPGRRCQSLALCRSYPERRRTLLSSASARQTNSATSSHYAWDQSKHSVTIASV